MTPYGYEEYEEYNWKSLVKRIVKYVVIIAVIGAIGWFVYDYFIGSFLTVDISVQNLESKPVRDNSIEVTETSSGTSAFEGDGLANYSVRLRRGDYTITVRADGYDTEPASVTFNEETKSKTVKLKKDIDVEIVALDMPGQLFANQAFDIVVTLENKSKNSEELELKYDGDFEKFDCRAVDKPILIGGKQTADYNVRCAVPSKTGREGATSGDEQEGKVGVMYTLESKDIEFELFPEPKISMDDSVKFSNMHPVENKKTSKEFEVNNRAKFPVHNIRLRIEITSAEKNDPGEVIKWVSFLHSQEEDKSEILIGEVRARDKHDETIEVNIPIDAKEETIYGSIVMEAPFLEDPWRSDLEIEIQGGAEALIEVNFENRQGINFKDGKPQDELDTIRVSNEGDLKVENIDLGVSSSDCTSSWLYFTSTSSIPYLDPKGGAIPSKEVSITVTAPTLAKVDDYVACVIWVSYQHPITGSIIQQEAGVMEIKREK